MKQHVHFFTDYFRDIESKLKKLIEDGHKIITLSTNPCVGAFGQGQYMAIVVTEKEEKEVLKHCEKVKIKTGPIKVGDWVTHRHWGTAFEVCKIYKNTISLWVDGKEHKNSTYTLDYLVHAPEDMEKHICEKKIKKKIY